MDVNEIILHMLLFSTVMIISCIKTTLQSLKLLKKRHLNQNLKKVSAWTFENIYWIFYISSEVSLIIL